MTTVLHKNKYLLDRLQEGSQATMKKWQSWVPNKGKTTPPKSEDVENDNTQKDLRNNECPDVGIAIDFSKSGNAGKETGFEAQENHTEVDCAGNSIMGTAGKRQMQDGCDGDAELFETMSLDISDYDPLNPGCNNIVKKAEDTSLPSAYLRLASTDMGDFPMQITVRIGLGEEYSIGRHDALVGKKQSDFEFDKNTRAVSRRHAVIERLINGYFITDVGSSAGTYINNIKITPARPKIISDGDLISFGKAGADYVWECNRQVT